MLSRGVQPIQGSKTTSLRRCTASTPQRCWMRYAYPFASVVSHDPASDFRSYSRSKYMSDFAARVVPAIAPVLSRYLRLSSSVAVFCVQLPFRVVARELFDPVCLASDFQTSYLCTRRRNERDNQQYCGNPYIREVCSNSLKRTCPMLAFVATS